MSTAITPKNTSAPGAIFEGATASAAGKAAGEDLILQIKSKDEAVRGAAWQTADGVGAAAIRPLAALMLDDDMEVARAAKRGLWKMVRHAGRPGAEKEHVAVTAELLNLLAQPGPIRREALWMLSEIGGADAVKPITELLTDHEVREDARAALERIPGEASVAALKAALALAPDDFKAAIAQSLRVRGVQVAGYPSQKLVPTRPAAVGAIKP